MLQFIGGPPTFSRGPPVGDRCSKDIIDERFFQKESNFDKKKEKKKNAHILD